jgi:hypothetical protein
MLQSGRMNQVLEQVVVFMQCSSQAGRVKFMTRNVDIGVMTMTLYSNGQQGENIYYLFNRQHI